MYDAFNSGGGSKTKRRFGKTSGPICSASRGVRYGFIAEEERPLREGEESKRKARRIPASFYVLKSGEWKRVSGDLSSGGALVLSPEKIVGNRVRLLIQMEDGSGSWQVSGEILSFDRRGDRFGHHVRFSNTAEIRGLAEAIEKAFTQGDARLQTT